MKKKLHFAKWEVKCHGMDGAKTLRRFLPKEDNVNVKYRLGNQKKIFGNIRRIRTTALHGSEICIIRAPEKGNVV